MTSNYQVHQHPFNCCRRIPQATVAAADAASRRLLVLKLFVLPDPLWGAEGRSPRRVITSIRAYPPFALRAGTVWQRQCLRQGVDRADSAQVAVRDHACTNTFAGGLSRLSLIVYTDYPLYLSRARVCGRRGRA